MRVIDNLEEYAAETGLTFVQQGEASKSILEAPLISSGKVFGRISLQNLDRYSAFGEADIRLLMTLASSLSVALDNARLFDETQRLLTETNERAAELAIINSVQQGLAENLDMQSMYDLVGDKIAEIFDAHAVDIGLYDFEREMILYPVQHRARQAIARRRRSVRSPLTLRAHQRGKARRHQRLRRMVERETGSSPNSDRRRGAEVDRVRAARYGRQALRPNLASEPGQDARVSAMRTCDS